MFIGNCIVLRTPAIIQSALARTAALIRTAMLSAPVCGVHSRAGLHLRKYAHTGGRMCALCARLRDSTHRARADHLAHGTGICVR